MGKCYVSCYGMEKLIMDIEMFVQKWKNSSMALAIALLKLYMPEVETLDGELDKSYLIWTW